MGRNQQNCGQVTSHPGSAGARRGRRGPQLAALVLAMATPVAAWATTVNDGPTFTAAADESQTASDEALTLSFSAAVERTLSQNAAMDLSQARINQARAAIEQANGNLLPTLDLSFGVMASNNPLNVFGMKLQQEQASFDDFGAGEFFQAAGNNFTNLPQALETEPDNLNEPGWHHNLQTSLKLSVPVYNGGKIREMRTQAQALLQAAQAGNEAARQQLVLHTIEAYAGINTAQAFVEVARQAHEAAASFRDLSQKLYDEGVVTKADLLKAKVNLGERELDLENARNQAENAADGLKVLTGIETARSIDLTETIDVALPETDLAQARQRALMNNPRIAALRGQVDAARAEVDVARADFKPHFNLMAQQDLNNESVGLENDSYTVGGQLTWRIFDFGARSGKVDRAQAKVNASLAERQQALDKLISQVGKVWREANMAEKRVEVRRLAIDQSEEAVRLETLRYQQGLATMTELLAAQTELDHARAELIRAYFQRTMQRAALWLALGDLAPERVATENGNGIREALASNAY